MHFSKMASASLWSHELLTFPRLHEEAKATLLLGESGWAFCGNATVTSEAVT